MGHVSPFHETLRINVLPDFGNATQGFRTRFGTSKRPVIIRFPENQDLHNESNPPIKQVNLAGPMELGPIRVGISDFVCDLTTIGEF